ncbi:MAG: hypothetical protein KME11_07960 [Timaviella obliquedivisa GSE-PSE-MK23-08B]|jgi:hypothetical protein|nr:hypothetical protein [Timaviella obliquedivisa GSE-PSE-MK23-08B]
MTDPARDAASVIDLLIRYSFDLSGYTVDRLAEYWLQRYPSDWIRLAIVEALYQGRYKAVSVEQILNLWQRRGKPLHHFSPDFERIITPRLIKGRAGQPEVIILPTPYAPPALKLELNTLELDLLELDTLELELPKPLMMPRPMGAIQPLPVSGILLPTDTMFQRFYAQLVASGLQEFTDVESTEAPPHGHLEETAPLPIDSEPEFLPPSIAELQAETEPTVRGLPIQPFKPSSDETWVDSLEIVPQVKDASSPPIHQFVPTLAPSEFYAKLKAIVQNAGRSRFAKNSEPTQPPKPPNP